MNKKLKTLLIICGIIVVLGIAIAAVLLIKPANGGNEGGDDIVYTLTDISVADVGAVAIVQGENSFGMMCSANGITLITPDDQSGKKSAMYSQTELRSFVYAACHISSAQKLSGSVDPDDYGAKAPLCVITLMDNAGGSTQFKVLSKSSVGDSYYISVMPDETAIYLIDSTVAEIFLRPASDFVSHSVFPAIDASNYGSVSEVTLKTADGGYTVANKNGVFYLTEPIEQRLRTASVYSSLLTALGGLYGDTCVEVSGGLKACGYDTPEIVIGMSFNGSEYLASFVRDGEGWLMENCATGTVYSVNADAVALLPKDEIALMDGAPYYYSLGDCTSVELGTSAKQLLFEISGSGETISAAVNGKTLDADAVMALSSAINGAELVRRIDGADGSAEITILFTLTSGSREKVELVPIDASAYAVRINGVTNFSASSASVKNILNIMDKY